MDGQGNSFLLVDAGYFLLREIKQALLRLGHRPIILRLPLTGDTGLPDPARYGDFLRQVAAAVWYFHPKALLTVNHLGFDREGILTEMLERLKLPALVWYVDSPRYIFRNPGGNVSPWIGVFVWDKSYTPWLLQVGFDKVHYLPLGTDPGVFSSVASNPMQELAHLQESVVFVGESMTATVQKALSKLPPPWADGWSPQANGEWAALAERFCQAANSNGVSHRVPPWEILDRLLHHREKPDSSTEEGQKSLQIETRLDLESALTLWATQKRRASFLSGLMDRGQFRPLVIYGDSAWREMLTSQRPSGNGGFELLPPVHYYDELPAIYRGAGALLNLTGLQMPSGINQRCYDVPAAGGFLLTDRQETLSEQFEPEQEMATFATLTEAQDKLEYYGTHPDQRRQIIQSGHRRVLMEHTYQHRVSEMLAVAKSWFHGTMSSSTRCEPSRQQKATAF